MQTQGAASAVQTSRHRAGISGRRVASRANGAWRWFLLARTCAAGIVAGAAETASSFELVDTGITGSDKFDGGAVVGEAEGVRGRVVHDAAVDDDGAVHVGRGEKQPASAVRLDAAQIIAGRSGIDERCLKERLLRLDQIELFLCAFVADVALVSSSIVPESLRKYTHKVLQDLRLSRAVPLVRAHVPRRPRHCGS